MMWAATLLAAYCIDLYVAGRELRLNLLQKYGKETSDCTKISPSQDKLIIVERSRTYLI